MGFLRSLKQKTKTLLGWSERSAVILMYHRVADVESSPYQVSVSPVHFEQQLGYINSVANILPLIGLAEAMEQNHIPGRSVVITFDDGYADNYEYAYPILKKLQIPATIFITSSYIGSHREFWWDELERIFLQPKKLPEEILLRSGDQVITLNLARETKEQRIQLLRGFQSFLRCCLPADRESIVRSLLLLSGISENGRSAYRPMTASEIAYLSRSGIVDIGAHTMTHQVLSVLGREEQLKEIQGSINAVEKIVGIPVNTFAYPFGSELDINQTTHDILSGTGIRAAVTTTVGKVYPHTDPLKLPRVNVGDWDLKTFRQKIDPFILGIE